MIEQDSQELFQILNERISTKKSTENEFQKLRLEFEEEKEILTMKLDNLTSNNNLLREENKTLSLKNDELTRTCFSQELTIKELESKYNEILSSMEKNYNHYAESNHEEEAILV